MYLYEDDGLSVSVSDQLKGLHSGCGAAESGSERGVVTGASRKKIYKKLEPSRILA